jgi:hypothetical protein
MPASAGAGSWDFALNPDRAWVLAPYVIGLEGVRVIARLRQLRARPWSVRSGDRTRTELFAMGAFSAMFWSLGDTPNRPMDEVSAPVCDAAVGGQLRPCRRGYLRRGRIGFVAEIGFGDGAVRAGSGAGVVFGGEPVGGGGAVGLVAESGKKCYYTTLPYAKVQAFSVETAGQLDLDAELEMWFNGLGKVRLEFKGQVDIRGIGQMLAHYVP